MKVTNLNDINAGECLVQPFVQKKGQKKRALNLIKSLATTPGEFSELDITLSVSGSNAYDRRLLMAEAIPDPRDGLTAIGIARRSKM